MDRVLEKDMLAIVPAYLPDRGNCTRIYVLDEQPIVIEKTISTVIKAIGRYHLIDLESMRITYGRFLNSPNLSPISLNQNDIFIPVKVRKPIGRNDKAFGYINIKYIKDIKRAKDSSIILLTNDIEIKSLSRIKTIQRHLSNGYIVKRFYDDRFKRKYDDISPNQVAENPKGAIWFW